MLNECSERRRSVDAKRLAAKTRTSNTDREKTIMTYNTFGSSQQPVKRKVFVSYHHGGDQVYYDAFSKVFCDKKLIINTR
jgi:hypothetical protein